MDGSERRTGEVAGSLERAFGAGNRVTSFTHNLYRYPARFSPSLVRAALENFTEPGELVLDPFVGGGTTAVEAMALGRRFVGADINSLGILISRAKTTLLVPQQLDALRAWIAAGAIAEGGFRPTDPRVGNAPPRFLEVMAPFRDALDDVADAEVGRAARLLLLDVGQWAIEGRGADLDQRELSAALEGSLARLQRGLEELEAAGANTDEVPMLFHGPADKILGPNLATGAVSLVVTSPPYPGVHVLYHRWQVRGRRETALPYWLADVEDGAGPSYYMMGSRRTRLGEETYFRRAAEIWGLLWPRLKPGAMVVQVIAFSSPDLQLPRYLALMADAGFARRQDLEPADWRVVPNRRWYNRVDPDRAPGRELLLVHEARRPGP